MGHLLDGHMASLSLRPDARKAAAELRRRVSEQLSVARACAPLAGMLVHAQRAPRDAATEVMGAGPPLYSVEVMEAAR